MSTILYELTNDPSNMNAVLVLKSPLTIQNAQELKNLFQQALAQAKNLYILHDEVDQFDISYLQLLIALDKTATSLKKTVRVTGHQPVRFSELLKLCGLPTFSWLEKETIVDEQTEEQR